MLLAIVERAERPRGPEQALNILFRDSNTNAVDIEEKKREKRNKFLQSMELFLGPRFVGRWGRLGAPDAGKKVCALTGRVGSSTWWSLAQVLVLFGTVGASSLVSQAARFFKQHLRVRDLPRPISIQLRAFCMTVKKRNRR